MNKPVIFLDVDGVLNRCNKLENGYYGTEKDCVEQFNRILTSTDSEFIVSSSWRYMVHEESMTNTGFANMLKTHGVLADRMIGITVRDEDEKDRNKQIALKTKQLGDRAYIAIDDSLSINREFLYREASRCLVVMTDSRLGITARDADNAIDMIKIRKMEIQAQHEADAINKAAGYLECRIEMEKGRRIWDVSDLIAKVINRGLATREQATEMARILFPESFN